MRLGGYSTKSRCMQKEYCQKKIGMLLKQALAASQEIQSKVFPCSVSCFWMSSYQLFRQFSLPAFLSCPSPLFGAKLILEAPLPTPTVHAQEERLNFCPFAQQCRGTFSLPPPSASSKRGTPSTSTASPLLWRPRLMGREIASDGGERGRKGRRRGIRPRLSLFYQERSGFLLAERGSNSLGEIKIFSDLANARPLSFLSLFF